MSQPPLLDIQNLVKRFGASIGDGAAKALRSMPSIH
mgnify:CR=1 FL=1